MLVSLSVAIVKTGASKLWFKESNSSISGAIFIVDMIPPTMPFISIFSKMTIAGAALYACA